jgi:hypothetical protein
MHFRIREVTDQRTMREFIILPESIYRNDSNFVPHLLSERIEFFSKRNPSFEHIEARYFLATGESNQPLGRVSAHIHQIHNKTNGGKTGFFGFFESVENIEVAGALMHAAENWLRSQGMTVIQGPYNFSTNDECGFLFDGYDRPPAILMTYSKAYYISFFEQLGYKKERDLLTFDYHYQGKLPEILTRFEERARFRNHITIRPINLREFDREIDTILNLYNSAWEMNWGFIPLTESEFRYMAGKIRKIMDPSLALIAEIEGKPVAFALSLPDYNELLMQTNGRLLPFGFLKILFGKRKIKKIRLILLGIVKGYRNRGIDISIYLQMFKNCRIRGYQSCEISWILEDNNQVIDAVHRIGGAPGKIYRIYGKSLQPELE